MTSKRRAEGCAWLQSLGRGGLIRSANAFAWWPIAGNLRQLERSAYAFFARFFNSMPGKASLTDHYRVHDPAREECEQSGDHQGAKEQ